MNKIILMPVFVMVLLVLFGTIIAISDNPSDNPSDNSDPVYVSGQWVSNNLGQWGWLPAEHSDDKTWTYPALGTGDWLNLYFNPSLPENQHKSFSIFNMDKKEYEYYDNYADFVDSYPGAESSDFTIADIFDTTALWFLIAGILTAGTVLGVAIFGSGLSEWAQRMIFINGGWGALWFFLSAGTSDILLTDTLGTFGDIIYISLTLTFIIGLILETSGGD